MNSIITNIRYKRATLLAGALASFILTNSCTEKSEQHNDSNMAYTIKENQIILNKDSHILSKLKLEAVVESDYTSELNSVGTVKLIPNSYAEIAAPFAGRILKSHIRLGQVVNAGSPIFDISSSDYFSAQKEYADARQELRKAELNLNRQKDLIKHGVGIQRELEEAETEFNIKKSALTNTSAALKVFNVTVNQTSLGRPLTIFSPIKGEVVSNSIVMGQYLKEDSEPIALVADLSKVWIAAQIKEKDLAIISHLKEADIRMDAFPDQIIHAKIYHINEMVNEETRSVEVIIECENKDRHLKPGMYVNVLFKNESQKAILVPSKAVFQKEDQQFVFVKTSKNTFEKRVVKTKTAPDDNIVIVSGLKTGETIVTAGGNLMLRNY